MAFQVRQETSSKTLLIYEGHEGPALDLFVFCWKKYDFSNKKTKEMVRFINKTTKNIKKQETSTFQHHLLFLFQTLPSIPSPISIFNIPPRDPSR